VACHIRTHACRGKGLQYLLGATKRAFSLFYIFWNSEYRQRFPLNILKLRLSPQIPTQIDWNLKIQKTTCCIEVFFKPSPLHPWTWLILMCDVTHSFSCVTWIIHFMFWHDWFILYMWRDLFILSVTWLIHLHVRRDSFILMCDVTHSFACATWLIHSHMWRDSFIFMFDMTDSFVYVTWLIHYCLWRDSFICMCDVTHSFSCVT